MTEDLKTHKLAEGLTVRIGYADGHVEIAYKAARFIPEVTTKVTVEELEAFPKVFAAALAWAEKVRSEAK